MFEPTLRILNELLVFGNVADFASSLLAAGDTK